MNVRLIKDIIVSEYPEVAFAEGFDDAIMGVVERYGMEPVVLYDKEKCLELLVKGGIDDVDDANEHFCYNVIGSWIGDNTPCFATIINK